ncbi:MAG: alanine--tRNA ligase-related protein [bacterium]
MMTHIELRTRIAAFWQSRGHVMVPGIPLIPQNDSTTLFTGSGMQQFVPNLMGEPHPSGTKVWNIQRCVRAQDIDEVGDNRHDTFFEMVGNWSFGDYFKKEQLPWMWDLYTNKDYGFGLDPSRLYVTVFAGEGALGPDTESIEIWKEIFANAGIKAEVGTEETFHKDQRITLYGAKKNWWSRAGAPSNMPAGEIGGPDSELFYDFGEEHIDKSSPDQSYHPNSDSGRFIEIGNSVFVQYIKEADGSLKVLPKKNVDFGGGFERILAAVHGTNDIFTTDVFAPIVTSLISNYAELEPAHKRNIRIVADHIRTAVNMAADGIVPGAKEQSYVMRRLVRRAVRAAQSLSIAPSQLQSAVAATVQIFTSTYPAVNNPQVISIVMDEITKYLQTLENGKRNIERFIKSKTVISSEVEKSQAIIDGKDLFALYQSTGVPVDDVADIARELGATVDIAGIEEAKKAHADASRGASEQKFKGGLADSSEQVVRYHTATHLIHKALFDTCGATVKQEGSNITGERLRFDFACDHKPTPDEIVQIQSLVNEKIQENLPVTYVVMPKDQAIELGAKSFFREKYPDEVKVYFVGSSISEAYSKELCGGPHVKNTSEIGSIEIYKCEKIGKQIFRIYAK